MYKTLKWIYDLGFRAGYKQHEIDEDNERKNKLAVKRYKKMLDGEF